MRGPDDRAADGIQRPEARAADAAAQPHAEGRSGRFADQHEGRQRQERRDGAEWLLDVRELVAEDRRQRERDREGEGGTDETQDRPEESGPGAGQDPEGEERQDGGVEEVHGPAQPTANAEIPGHRGLAERRCVGCRVSASIQTT